QSFGQRRIEGVFEQEAAPRSDRLAHQRENSRSGFLVAASNASGGGAPASDLKLTCMCRAYMLRAHMSLRPVEFQVLLALAGDERHGYGIMQEAARLSGGEAELEPGTLYRALHRMLAAGWLAESGRSRHASQRASGLDPRRRRRAPPSAAKPRHGGPRRAKHARQTGEGHSLWSARVAPPARSGRDRVADPRAWHRRQHGDVQHRQR